MHIFLLNIPRLEFAAIIPKGDYATVCLLGRDIDDALLTTFLTSAEVRRCMPEHWDPDSYSCACAPRMNVRGAPRLYGDRILFIGDCGVTRLYKDGIGFAYRAAKAAARAVVFHGISEASLRRHYAPVCRRVAVDNQIGRVTFAATRVLQRLGVARRAVLLMTARESDKNALARHMSSILWDLFTGSASYRAVFQRSLHPAFLGRLGSCLAEAAFGGGRNGLNGHRVDASGSLGKSYRNGEVIVQQGEIGCAMYVILEGRAEILMEQGGQSTRLRIAGPGEIIGEMALIDRTVRSATVRALGETRVLTVDSRTFMERIADDPTIATRVFEVMSKRIRELSTEVARLKGTGQETSAGASMPWYRP